MSEESHADDNSKLANALKRSAAGDRSAFKTIYDLTSGKLFALIVSMVKDREAAEDILQQVYVSIWKNAGRFDEEKGRALSWIMVIARNRTLDALRSRQRAASTEELADTLPDERSQSPEECAETAILSDILAAQLAALPERMASAIRLNILIGLTSSEIADQLGVSRNTVKSWVRRGMEKLKADLPLESYQAAKL